MDQSTFVRPLLPSLGLLVGAFASLTTPALADGFPVVGGVGFDWLHPARATCQTITQADAAGFQRCIFDAQANAFGLRYPMHRCQASGGREYLIYASKAQCSQAFQTMEANAP
ncbi:MAG: hypothetical protein RLZZ609_117 [Cyanobacteriota bacterium]|jgi:hypothetical protein